MKLLVVILAPALVGISSARAQFVRVAAPVPGPAPVAPAGRTASAEAPPAEPPASFVAARDTLLESLGATSSASLYLGYLSLASVRDQIEAQQYDARQVDELVASIASTVELVSEQFKRIRRFSGISVEDASLIELMDEVAVLLKDQADQLRAYARTGSGDDLRRFENVQSRTLEKLKELFGDGPAR